MKTKDLISNFLADFSLAFIKNKPVTSESVHNHIFCTRNGEAYRVSLCYLLNDLGKLTITIDNFNDYKVEVVYKQDGLNSFLICNLSMNEEQISQSEIYVNLASYLANYVVKEIETFDNYVLSKESIDVETLINKFNYFSSTVVELNEKSPKNIIENIQQYWLNNLLCMLYVQRYKADKDSYLSESKAVKYEYSGKTVYELRDRFYLIELTFSTVQNYIGFKVSSTNKVLMNEKIFDLFVSHRIFKLCSEVAELVTKEL